MGLDNYVEAHFPDKCRRDFNLWETGLWNFEEVWPTAVELYTLGEDFSYHHCGLEASQTLRCMRRFAKSFCAYMAL